MNELTYSTPSVRRPKKAPGPTAKARAKRRRAEDKVEKAVRAACVVRDGDCRICHWERNIEDWHEAGVPYPDGVDWERGESQWSHLESRARTRNMRPDLRHNTKTSVMLCKFHHDRLDGRARPRIRVELQTGEGADGPLTWRTA